MLRKALSLAAVLAVATIGVAHAQPYPPAGDSISVGGDLYPGGSVTITAQTFRAGAVVSFTVNTKPAISGSAVANGAGVATFNAALPNSTKPGSYLAKAKGTGADGKNLTLTQGFTVESGPASVLGQSISKADTFAGDGDGFPTLPAAFAGVAGAGLLLLLGRRRLSSKSATPADEPVSV